MRIKKIRQSLGAIGKVADSYTTDSNACYNAPYVNSLQPTVLWTNSSPTTEFTGQSITLNDDISNYNYYEIIFNRTTGGTVSMSTGKIPVGKLVQLNMISNYNYFRSVTALSGTTMTFGTASYFTTYGGSSATLSNNTLIPYQVLGYK